MSAARALRAWAVLCALALTAPALTAPSSPLCGAGPSALWGEFVIGADHGSLQSHALTIAAGGASVASAATWDAAEMAAAPDARKIYTLASATIPFLWTALPPELRDLLDADGQGEARVAYLRGDRNHEFDGLFRKRGSIPGAVTYSVPLIVGAPPASAGAGHAAFREQFQGRTTAVYVGASDAMLHAFDARDGAELFAYVPRTLIAALPALSDPAAPARPTMDGSAGQGDALVGGRWRTVLASGMGMGARGVFALDISDPSAFADGLGALWEFSDKDDAAIGYVQAPPQFARIKGADFAVVTSAIDSPQANGSLFLLALDKPAQQAWRSGVNYHRIATSGADPALANALSAPVLVRAADGSATLAYAGDLQGRLWRFDLAARTAQHLFTARDDAGRSQPIAYAPKVVFAPGGGYLVLFATGRLIEQEDLLPSSFLPQSMYAIHDRLEVPAQLVRSRAQLARRTLAGKDSYTVTGAPIDYFAPNAKRGWFADFPNTGSDGERAAGSPAIADGSVIFSTLLPGSGSCEAAASRVYVLDALSGLPATAVTAELVQSVSMLPPLLLEVTATAALDATSAATASRSYTVVRPESAPAGKAATFTVRFPARRMGWREVANWDELHDAAKK